MAERTLTFKHCTDFNRDVRYLVTVPLAELEHAVAIMGWTCLNSLPSPVADDVREVIEELHSRRYIQMPEDIRSWWQTYATRKL